MSLDKIEHTVEGGRIVIQLEHPIEAGDKVIGELRFRKPGIGDMRGLDFEEDEVGATIDLTSRLTGVAPPVLDRVDLGDWPKVQGVVLHFLRNSLATGSPSKSE